MLLYAEEKSKEPLKGEYKLFHAEARYQDTAIYMVEKLPERMPGFVTNFKGFRLDSEGW